MRADCALSFGHLVGPLAQSARGSPGHSNELDEAALQAET